MSGSSSQPALTEHAAQSQLEDETIEAPGLVDRRIDIAVCLAVFLLGLALMILSNDIRQGSIPDPIGPDGWPKLLGATLMICMAANIIRRLLSWHTSPGNMVVSDGGKEEVPGAPSTFIRPLSFLTAALIWSLIVQWTGFIIATTALLIAGLALMQVRRPAKLLLVPLIFSLAIWLLFGVFFGIRLPEGPVEHTLIHVLPV